MNSALSFSLSTARIPSVALSVSFFFFNDTATTEIYTLSLHDALPISWGSGRVFDTNFAYTTLDTLLHHRDPVLDRKSTRLNSSHSQISYAVFCLKKKKKLVTTPTHTSYDH